MYEVIEFKEIGKLNEILIKYESDVLELIRLKETIENADVTLHLIDLFISASSDRHDKLNATVWDNVALQLAYQLGQEIKDLFKSLHYEIKNKIADKVHGFILKNKFDEMIDYVQHIANNYQFYVKESMLLSLQNDRGNFKTNQKNRIKKIIFNPFWTYSGYSNKDMDELNGNARNFERDFNILFPDVKLYDKFISYQKGTTHITLTKEAEDIINSLLADNTKIGL